MVLLLAALFDCAALASQERVDDSEQSQKVGYPDLDTPFTSHIERSNLTVRMMLRRFTRLTNGQSKSWKHHEAAISLLVAVYNFCRPHMTLNERMGYKCTPAMAAGLTDHVWSVQELLEKIIPQGTRAIAS
jgi:hypothetical protein